MHERARRDLRLAVILVTDQVASTATRAALGEVATHLHKRQQDLTVARILESYGGQNVKSTGDGLQAVFLSPSAAIDAAVVIQRSVPQSTVAGADVLPLRVGLDVGEVWFVDDDIEGLIANRTHRVCGEADGGQILATGDVIRLSSRHPHPVTALGTRALRGIEHDPVELHEVSWRPGAQRLPLPPPVLRHRAERLVGRSDELAAVLTRLSGTDRTSLTVLTGEPGIGKTALASAVASALHEQGWQVLWGHSSSDSAPREPFATMYRWFGDLVSQGLVAGAALGQRPLELETLIAPPGAGVATSVLATAVSSWLAAVADSRPTLLVLDDVQWIDGDSLRLLERLLGDDRPDGVHVLLTMRPRDVRGATRAVLDELAHRPGATTVRLEGLAPDAVRELTGVEGDLGDLVALSGGNPLLLRLLVDDPGGGARRDVVTGRLAQLDDDDRAVLEAAAVLGSRSRLAEVARLTDRDPSDLLDRLSSPPLDQLVVTDASAASAEFVHDLIRASVLERCATTRRRELHRGALDLLVGGALDVERADAIAQHALAAAGPGERIAALEHVRTAARVAGESHAEATAVRHRATVVELLREVGDREHLPEALLDLGRAQNKAGASEHRTTLDEAFDLAWERRDAEVAAACLLAAGRGTFSRAGSVDEARVEQLRRALRMPGLGDVSRARLTAALSSELFFSVHRLDEAGRLGDEALALARDLGGPVTQEVLRLRFHSTWRMGGERDRLAATEELVTAAPDPADEWARFWACSFRAQVLGEVGRADEAEDHIVEAEAIAARSHRPDLQWFASHLVAARAVYEGQLRDAERLAALTYELGLRAGQPDTDRFFSGLMNLTLRTRGRSRAVLELIDEHHYAPDGAVEPYLAHLAAVCLEAGDPDRARQCWRAAGGRAHIAEQADDLRGALMYAQCGLVALCFGDGELAELTVERLAGHEELAPYVVGWHPVLARSEGLAMAALGRRDRAIELIEWSAQLHRERRMRAYLAEDLTHLGVLRGDDRVLDEAATVAERAQAWPTRRYPGIVAQTVAVHERAGG